MKGKVDILSALKDQDSPAWFSLEGSCFTDQSNPESPQAATVCPTAGNLSSKKKSTTHSGQTGPMARWAIHPGRERPGFSPRGKAKYVDVGENETKKLRLPSTYRSKLKSAMRRYGKRAVRIKLVATIEGQDGQKVRKAKTVQVKR